MTAISWYILKVLIISGILYGYYFVALKDKAFHRWNRFYLLFSVALSLLLPFVKINIFDTSVGHGTVAKVLQTITIQDEVIIESGKANIFNYDLLIMAGYILVSLFFVGSFVAVIIRIYKMKRKFPLNQIRGINFINTNADGTPFSFFNSIFWNRDIDLSSVSGQQILDHEIAHIREKHTYDKIFMDVILWFFWLNPIFWFVRKELNMIHEFIADKMALEDADINAFAEMILASVYPKQQFSITNHFFYSPIKRRILMLTKNKNPKVNYLSRLLVLPLAAIVFMAFTIKMNHKSIDKLYDGKIITVMIDAGHGGNDFGANEGAILEKNLALDIAKQVKLLNNNDKINIILTRNNDQTISVTDRVALAEKENADLFISIHLETTFKKNALSGLNILIPNDNIKFLGQSRLLGSSIVEAFKNKYPLPLPEDLTQRVKGLYILNHQECPAVLVAPAFISNQKDLDYISKAENQKIVAQNILNGIEMFASRKDNYNAYPQQKVSDTVPDMKYKNKKVESLVVKPAKQEVKVVTTDGKSETISVKEAEKQGLISVPGSSDAEIKIGHMPTSDFLKGKQYEGDSVPVIIVDGTEIPYAEISSINPDDIESITVLKGKSVGNKYGLKGNANGVIVIATKSGTNNPQEKSEIVFTKTEHEAEFPGGNTAFSKFLSKILTEMKDSLSADPASSSGTCIVRFIVNKSGIVSDVQATTMKGTKLADVAVDAIRKGPKWIPAMQNGRNVNSYHLLPITYRNPD